MKINSLILLLLLLSSCSVTLRHEEVPPTPVSHATLATPVTDASSGMVYALPKTGLRFTITAQKTEKKRGEFYLYSERYLGLKDVILEDAVEWEIKGITVTPFGLANADEMFQITSSSKHSVPLVQLSEDGVLLSVNSELPVTEHEETPATVKPQDDFVVPYTEEMLLANSSAKMAQEAANYIYRLRESRTALLAADLNTLPPDGEAYAMSLDQINNLESQFLSLFKGQELVSCVTETIEVIPDEIKARDVLFRFSSFAGLVAPDDLSGSPVFITMEKGDMPSLNLASADSTGIFYKLPAPVQVKVFDGSTEVLSQNILMGQFGELQALSPYLLNDDVKIQFYPTTGAIKAISK